MSRLSQSAEADETSESVRGVPGSRGAVLAAAGALVLLGIVAYANSFSGQFIFDDYGHIVDSPGVQHIGPVRKYWGMTRPVCRFALALNYHRSGKDVWGWHLVNLSIHLGCGLLLFGLARTALRSDRLKARFAPWSLPVAWAVAAVWLVHPLGTQAVTYIVQRDESLTSLLYLLTLYGVVRYGLPRMRGDVNPALGGEQNSPLRKEGVGVEATDRAGPSTPASRRGLLTPRVSEGPANAVSCRGASSRAGHPGWAVLAVGACALGMGCKEIIATAPVMALLYDRAFLAGSFREALSRRRGLYLALAATWGILAAVLLSANIGSSAGFGGVAAAGAAARPVGPLQYAASQPEVILRYLRLAFWPVGLVFDYGWEPARSAGEIVPYAAAIAVLLAGTIWGLVRRPALGFLGAWFFLILAPTSSVLPIADLAVEHRMYLPLAGVVALVVCGAFALGRRVLARSAAWSVPESGIRNPESPARDLRPMVGGGVAVVALLAILAFLTVLTIRRNGQYADELGMWRDVTEKSPRHYRGFCNYGQALERRAQGERDPEKARQDIERAVDLYHEAMRINPEDEYSMVNLGAALVKLGETDQAVEWLEKALKVQPDCADAHVNLGAIRLRQGDPAAAAAHLRAAVQASPGDVKARLNLGLALMQLKEFEQAEQEFNKALHLRPDMPEVYCMAGAMYDEWGKTDKAVNLFRHALDRRPEYPEALERLGVALLRDGRTSEAVQAITAARRIRQSLLANRALAAAMSAAGQDAQAVAGLRKLLEAKPDLPGVAGTLAWLLATSPEDRARDGPMALRLAQSVSRITGDREALVMDIEAAALAEDGQFDRAVMKADQAAAAAGRDGRTDLAEEIRRRREAYSRRQAWRDRRPIRERMAYLLLDVSTDTPAASSSR